jgi:ribosome-associated translation inhibitor RaiA
MILVRVLIMQMPMQVSFRHIAVSPEVETECLKEAATLERYFDRIIGCRVRIEQPKCRHVHGHVYRVVVQVAVPGKDLIVHRDPPPQVHHEEVTTSIREAFDSVRRMLEEYVALRRETRDIIRASGLASA